MKPAQSSGLFCCEDGSQFCAFMKTDLSYVADVNVMEQMTQLAKQAKTASRELAKLSTTEKNACLLAMADALAENAEALKQANAQDMEVGVKMGLSAAMLDRLKLDEITRNPLAPHPACPAPDS